LSLRVVGYPPVANWVPSDGKWRDLQVERRTRERKEERKKKGRKERRKERERRRRKIPLIIRLHFRCQLVFVFVSLFMYQRNTRAILVESKECCRHSSECEKGAVLIVPVSLSDLIYTFLFLFFFQSR